MSGPKFLVVIIWILRGAESNTWEIKMPQKIDVISGFCVQIPCQFEIPDSFKKSLTNSVEAIWRKTAIDGANILNSDSELSPKGNVIGNILNKNCTTVFHSFPAEFSDIYFFRLHGPEPLRYTFNQGVNITVHKDVPPPVLSPLVQVLEILEGTKLTFTCSTVISCPSIKPLMQWNPQLGEQLTPALQEDEFGQKLLVSSQTFNATSLNDRLKVSCSLLYSQGSKRPVETSVIIRVLYAPKNTIALVSPSDPVSEGSVVMLSCHSNANPAVRRYEWYKDSGSGKLVLQNQGQNLTMIARSNVQGLYVCKVYNNHGTDQSRAVTVDINSCQCSIAPYIICGLLTLFLILVTVVDLVKYKRNRDSSDQATFFQSSTVQFCLLKRLQEFEGMRGSMTYATLHRTSDSVYNVIQTRGSRTDEDYENRNLNKHQSKSEPWPRS